MGFLRVMNRVRMNLSKFDSLIVNHLLRVERNLKLLTKSIDVDLDRSRRHRKFELNFSH